MRSVQRLCASLVAATLLTVAGSAEAADPREESRAAFMRGVAEAHAKHFTAARDAFLEAYRIFPHPSILMNLGIARMRTGEYVAAEEDLARFLSDDGGAPAEDVANARAALAETRRHIGTLRIRISPEGARALLDGVPLALVPGTFGDVRAVIGPAELRVEAAGLAPSVRQLVAERDQIVSVDVILVPVDLTAPPGAAEHPRPIVAWSLFGAAGALAVVGTVAGVEALTLAHEYNTPGTASYLSSPVKDRGVEWRTGADILFATAVVSAAAGIYFLFRPPVVGSSMRAAATPRSVTFRVDF